MIDRDETLKRSPLPTELLVRRNTPITQGSNLGKALHDRLKNDFAIKRVKERQWSVARIAP
jgi:hypothetical protein